MKKVNIVFPTILLGLLCVFAAVGINCSKQSAAEIAKELANTLTNDLNFENGTPVKGQPPAITTGAPVVTGIKADSTLFPGQKFEITLTTNSRQFEGQTGAILYVVKTYGDQDAGPDSGQSVTSDSYISVTAAATKLADTYTMVLKGTFAGNDKLFNEAFTVWIGMSDSRGVGGYKAWNVGIDSGTCASASICQKTCSIFDKCDKGEGSDNSCRQECPDVAPKFLATLAAKILDCANITNCDEAFLCFQNTFSSCPSDNIAKQAFCAKKLSCDQTPISICMASPPPVDNPNKWVGANCTCTASINQYKNCLNNSSCTNYDLPDGGCPSYLGSIPNMNEERDGGSSKDSGSASRDSGTGRDGGVGP